MDGITPTWQGAPLVRSWAYRDSRGEPLGHVARYGANGHKAVIPFFSRNGSGFKPGAADGPRPLFGLDILAANPDGKAVVIVEGERCAAALQSLGIVAVTSQGGSKAAAKADWTPLSGVKKVYVLPDNDEPGQAYAADVCAALRALQKPPELFLVRLPGLPEKGDCVDWLQARCPEWDGFSEIPEGDRERLFKEFREALREHAEPVPEPPKEPAMLLPVALLCSDIRAIQWAVKGILPRDSLSVFFGPPATWKSLVALDIGLSVAAGLGEWCGHRVKPGPVVYVCGEGRHGLSLRAEAWFRRNGIAKDSTKFFVYSSHVSVLEESSVERLANAIRELCEPPAVVILDTLQRCFGPGDENSTADMTRFVARLDEYIRIPFGCCVLVVHHTGQSDKGRARGSIVLHASVDTEFGFTKDGATVTFANTKSKDGKPPDPLAFELESFELAGITDEDGNVETAPVLLSTTPPKRALSLTRNQLTIAGALDDMTGGNIGARVTYARLREKCRTEGMATSSFAHAFAGLLTGSVIQRDGPEVWLS